MGFFGGSKPSRRTSRPIVRARVQGANGTQNCSGNALFMSECGRAMEELKLKTSAHVGTWHMDEAEWSVDQENGKIEFTDLRRKILATADVQIIGTYDTNDSTWLWGWANPSLSEGIVADAKNMKEYGLKHSFNALTSSKCKCPDSMAWNLVALSCMVCGRQGAYRGPSGTTMVFMTFGEVTIAKIN